MTLSRLDIFTCIWCFFPCKECNLQIDISCFYIRTPAAAQKSLEINSFFSSDVELKIILFCHSYAIGGLSGGEDKNSFWRVVAQCTAALPEDKPRYVMVRLRMTSSYQPLIFFLKIY